METRIYVWVCATFLMLLIPFRRFHVYTSSRCVVNSSTECAKPETQNARSRTPHSRQPETQNARNSRSNHAQGCGILEMVARVVWPRGDDQGARASAWRLEMAGRACLDPSVPFRPWAVCPRMLFHSRLRQQLLVARLNFAVLHRHPRVSNQYMSAYIFICMYICGVDPSLCMLGA